MRSPTPAGSRTAASSRHGRAPLRLPSHLTSFIGRRDELGELATLIREHRQVTITGPGGSGKSRLLAETVSRAPEGLDGDIGWFDMGAIDDPQRLSKGIADSLAVRADSQRSLIQQLQGRRVLLCLDNCEHLAERCAALTTALLEACPDLTVVATSREPLEMAGEYEWRIPWMREREAADLFVDRARMVATGFAPDEDQADAIATIVRRLEGIPLAVELAAGWMRVLTPQQIAVALDDRLGLLVNGHRDVVERHRTLAASLDWSYGLLRHEPRTLLRRLGVFAGDFDLDAVVGVCVDDDLEERDVLPALRRLVAGSMVVAGDRDGTTRYRLTETLQEYATARLDEAEETIRTRDRHLDHFLAYAHAHARAFADDDRDVALADLDVEAANLRAALEWGLARPDPRRARQLTAALVSCWFRRGRAQEGLGYVDRAIERAPDDETSLQGDLYAGLATLAIPGGRPDIAAQASRRAIAIGESVGDDGVLARGAFAAIYQPFYVDLEEAEELARRSQHHALAADDPVTRDLAQLFEACTLSVRDCHGEAAMLAGELFDRCWRRHDRFCASFALAVRTWADMFTGDLRRAEQHAVEAVAIVEPLKDNLAVGTATTNLAWIKGLSGDVGAGLHLMSHVITSVEEAGTFADVIGMSLITGKLHLWAGDLDAAASWFEHSIGFDKLSAPDWMTGRALTGLARVRRITGRLDDAIRFADRALEIGSDLGSPHLRAEALDELGFLAAADDPNRAENLHHDALAVRVEHGLDTFVVDSLDAVAVLAIESESFGEAARVLAASDMARARIGYPRAARDRRAYDVAVATLTAALGDAGCADARAEGRELSLSEAVAYLTRARGERQRPSVGWGSLTPTELDVVDLVTEGLTNPEVADRLFVSRATVKTHLSHVYTKLDIANRTELATVAARHRAESS